MNGFLGNDRFDSKSVTNFIETTNGKVEKMTTVKLGVLKRVGRGGGR